MSQAPTKKGVCVVNLREHAIAVTIRTKLAEDTRTSGQTIDVFVADGDIQLIGIVDSELQRCTAEELIKGLPGVRRVVDNLRVRLGSVVTQRL
jgi:osmotically-inducible protein OsmY